MRLPLAAVSVQLDSLASDFAIDCESRYIQSGRTVTVDRRLRVQRESRVCGLKESREWLSFYRVIQRELRSQIVYR